MNKKFALCVGINDYPGTGDLQGCVNDALGWERLLTDEGYTVIRLLDSQATKSEILRNLRYMVLEASLGDRIVFTYSGHGSWIPDRDGDEPDGRDEVLCAYDYASGGLVSDDDLYSVMQQRKWGVRATIISDSCHSGSVARFGGPWRGGAQVGKARFLPPSAFLEGEALQRAVKADALPAKAIGSRPATILLSGCDDNEYSYDAWIDGKAQGAFSAYALRMHRPGDTFLNWHNKIRSVLPNAQYPQAPQLQGSLWQKRFGSL